MAGQLTYITLALVENALMQALEVAALTAACILVVYALCAVVYLVGRKVG